MRFLAVLVALFSAFTAFPCSQAVSEGGNEGNARYRLVVPSPVASVAERILAQFRATRDPITTRFRVSVAKHYDSFNFLTGYLFEPDFLESFSPLEKDALIAGALSTWPEISYGDESHGKSILGHFHSLHASQVQSDAIWQRANDRGRLLIAVIFLNSGDPARAVFLFDQKRWEHGTTGNFLNARGRRLLKSFPRQWDRLLQSAQAEIRRLKAIESSSLTDSNPSIEIAIGRVPLRYAVVNESEFYEAAEKALPVAVAAFEIKGELPSQWVFAGTYPMPYLDSFHYGIYHYSLWKKVPDAMKKALLVANLQAIARRQHQVDRLEFRRLATTMAWLAESWRKDPDFIRALGPAANGVRAAGVLNDREDPRYTTWREYHRTDFDADFGDAEPTRAALGIVPRSLAAPIAGMMIDRDLTAKGFSFVPQDVPALRPFLASSSTWHQIASNNRRLLWRQLLSRFPLGRKPSASSLLRYLQALCPPDIRRMAPELAHEAEFRAGLNERDANLLDVLAKQPLY